MNREEFLDNRYKLMKDKERQLFSDCIEEIEGYLKSGRNTIEIDTYSYLNDKNAPIEKIKDYYREKGFNPKLIESKRTWIQYWITDYPKITRKFILEW